MSVTELPPQRLTPRPLPGNIRSVQPGGGVCYRIELAWGRVRRWWLKRFFPGFVARMAALRTGTPDGAPHEILDPRDLKYCQNLCTADWSPANDPFRWRDHLPFARWGLAELILMGGGLVTVTAILAISSVWPLAFIPGALAMLVVWFFRDPPRTIPGEPNLMVSPADGKIAEITPLKHDEFIGGPAIRIGIFLSIFNVHLNRVPCAARVIELRYHPGAFLNALNPQSAVQNESMWIGLEEEAAPHRRLVVRQIAGTLARRIVCALRLGEAAPRGHKLGMIKLGSRTELILADTDGLHVEVAAGQRVQAGRTVIARYPQREA